MNRWNNSTPPEPSNGAASASPDEPANVTKEFVREDAPGRPPQRAATIDFDSLRLRVGGAVEATDRVQPDIQIRKPHRQEFFRIHPHWSLRTLIVTSRDDGRTYVVVGRLHEEVSATGDAAPANLVLAANREGGLFIYPLREPDLRGRDMPCHATARGAAAQAIERWTRLAWNAGLGDYEVRVARGDFGEPHWPGDVDAVVLSALKGAAIDDIDHVVLRRLRGEV